MIFQLKHSKIISGHGHQKRARGENPRLLISDVEDGKTFRLFKSSAYKDSKAIALIVTADGYSFRMLCVSEQQKVQKLNSTVN